MCKQLTHIILRSLLNLTGFKKERNSMFQKGFTVKNSCLQKESQWVLHQACHHSENLKTIGKPTIFTLKIETLCKEVQPTFSLSTQI